MAHAWGYQSKSTVRSTVWCFWYCCDTVILQLRSYKVSLELK